MKLTKQFKLEDCTFFRKYPAGSYGNQDIMWTYSATLKFYRAEVLLDLTHTGNQKTYLPVYWVNGKRMDVNDEDTVCENLKWAAT